MFRTAKFSAILVLFGLTSCAGASTCSFTKIDINAADTHKNDIFSGSSGHIEIRLNSEMNDSLVELFPEPPLTIINKKTQTQCNINGGVWVRNSVFVSSNRSTLATYEFSGSSGSLNFYDTTTCKMIATVDTSDYTWELTSSNLKMVRMGSKTKEKINYKINSACKPVLKTR